MNLDHIENALSHVTAQTFSVSIKIPNPLVLGRFEYEKLVCHPPGHIADLIMDRIHSFGAPPLWVKKVYDKANGDFLKIVEILFAHLDCVMTNGATYLIASDDRFPEELKEIPASPAAITVLGDKSLLKKPKIAIVGSRKAIPYALYQTEKLATWATDMGLVIVSGSAYGIDRSAHQGAINSARDPVPSITVLPSGFESLGPAITADLQRVLLEGNAIFLSERLWWSQSLARDFVMRNRLISGLCRTVLIMQAEIRSGSMNTARHALDQGSDIYVLRHSEGDVRAEGSARLIEEGALFFDSAEDFFLKVLKEKGTAVLS